MKDAAEKPASLRKLEGRLSALQQMLAPLRPLRIADVGANPVNTPDYLTLHKMGGAEVWGFEPDDAAFAALMENPLPGSHYIQRAVGKPGPAHFYPHPSTGLGSLLKIDEDAVGFIGHPGWYARQQDGIPIDIVALDDLSEDELPKPDLIKIDIQGGELDVFQHGRGKMSECIAVVTEVRFARIYENEPLWADLDIELRGQGMSLHKLMFAKSKQIGHSQRRLTQGKGMRNQLLDGDAVYVRDPLTMRDWTDEQVKQLAIAAAGVFDSYDLTFLCLDDLVRRGVLDHSAPQTFAKQLPRFMRERTAS